MSTRTIDDFNYRLARSHGSSGSMTQISQVTVCTTLVDERAHKHVRTLTVPGPSDTEPSANT